MTHLPPAPHALPTSCTRQRPRTQFPNTKVLDALQEVEKEVAEDEAAAASGSGRRSSGSGGAAKKKKVIELEYVYDADMEGEAL